MVRCCRELFEFPAFTQAFYVAAAARATVIRHILKYLKIHLRTLLKSKS